LSDRADQWALCVSALRDLWEFLKQVPEFADSTRQNGSEFLENILAPQ